MNLGKANEAQYRLWAKHHAPPT